MKDTCNQAIFRRRYQESQVKLRISGQKKINKRENWSFSTGRRYLSFFWVRKNHFSSKWIRSSMSKYLVRSTGSLKCNAINNLATLFSSVKTGLCELQCTQMVKPTIQRCTVVFNTPIDITRFLWVHLFCSRRSLTLSWTTSVRYIACFLQFFLGQIHRIPEVQCHQQPCHFILFCQNRLERVTMNTNGQTNNPMMHSCLQYPHLTSQVFFGYTSSAAGDP